MTTATQLPEFITGKKAKKLDKKATKAKKRGKGTIRASGDTGSPERRQRALEEDLAGLSSEDLAKYRKGTLKAGVAFEARERSSTGQATQVGARVEAQLPHDRYRNRGELDPTNSWRNGVLWEGAERLRRDFHASGLNAKLCSSFEPRVPSGGQQWASDKAVDALGRYKKAMNSVGQTLRPVLFYVTIAGESASAWAIRNGMVPQAGLAILRLSLAELAHHYGYVKIHKEELAKSD